MVQKIIRLNPRLFEDLAESAFGHITIMIGDGGVLAAAIIEPDFVAARRLPVECESVDSQHFGNFTISKS